MKEPLTPEEKDGPEMEVLKLIFIKRGGHISNPELATAIYRDVFLPLIEQEREKALPKWISVEDRLPTNVEYVWISEGPSSETEKGYCSSDYYGPNRPCWFNHIGDKRKVLFWQPFSKRPSPPKEK